ncbi:MULTISPECIES: hypothetical protein [Rodentibacter]|uniref:hypothetical protein n=1 Tax=Rodentibacter TaxID=1960084 RepID=UPI001CFC989C|nr:hypothetical protein [Rodentibacter sp. JRC1]GJI55871.1 hypothetical protein HEMROJRC1_09830 [Rodentibacter sp. JRC1]
MKPFNLEKALAGEAVVLRDGTVAYVKYCLFNEHLGSCKYPLRGYTVDDDHKFIEDISWTPSGLYFADEDKFEGEGNNDSDFDIVGMWEEPRRKVRIGDREVNAPVSVEEADLPTNTMYWFIKSDGTVLQDNNWTSTHKQFFDVGRVFASKEDAQAFIDAMKALVKE